MKTLFVFQIQSFTDVVTNSSSELFVFDGTTDTVENLLNKLYPEWDSEYYDPISSEELNEDQLYVYLSYAYDHTDWDRYYNKVITKENSRQTRWATEFRIDPNELYENYVNWNPSSDDYKISNLKLKKGWDKLIKQKLPKNLVFLFSKDDNPDYDKQELLEDFALRYHLG